MGLANDSITVTPGSGATVATHLVGGLEHQVVMIAEPDGSLIGSRPMYVYNIATQVHVAAASTIHFDLFNAHASLRVRVLSVRQKPDIVTAVTGVATTWNFRRTSAVGSGGTAQTASLPDTAQTALDAAITCRSKPTSGATSASVIKTYQIHSEETNTGNLAIAAAGGMELIPNYLVMPMDPDGILLRQNQGISVTQDTSSSAGNTAWEIVISVE